MMKFCKYLLVFVGLLLLLWFAAPPLIQGTFNSGTVVGGALSIVIGLTGLFLGKIIAFLFKTPHGTIAKVLIITGTVVISAILIIVSFLTVQMISHAYVISDQPTTVVVLGCRVRDDGPSRLLSERIDAAYRFLSENENAQCILSGGKGDDEPISEAQCMYNCLVERGIDGSRLYLEEKSSSTYENLMFSQRIILENGLCRRITLITNEFHQYRAFLIARNAGIESYSFSAKTDILFLPTYYIRELCGIVYGFIFQH